MSEFEEFMDGDDLQAEIGYLKKENRRLNRMQRQQSGLTATVVEAVRSVLEDMPPPKLPPRPRASRKARVEQAVLHMSDWQIGSLTEDFDTSIARERLNDCLIPKVRTLVEARRSTAKLDVCTVILGGDMVDGSGMRANHAWEVDSTVLEQALYSCPRMMADLVLAMMDLFPTVKVDCVRGNHGRSGPKSDPNPKTVNWDTAACRAAELMLKDLIDGERLSFHVEVENFYRILEIGQTKLLSVHGDQFRGSGGFAGIPLYGISKKMAHWSQSLAEWDVLMFGHFHSPTYGNFGTKQWYMNGTLQTGSPYALEELGMSSRPAQRLLIFDEDRGPIADHVIWLDK